MIFILNDGTTIIPEKKCNCKNHIGPHWFYINEKTRLENLQKKTGLSLTMAEIQRLKKLEKVMRENNVREIFRGIVS